MIKELKRRCERLSHNEKVELRDFLTLCIIEGEECPKTPLRASILLGEMKRIYGKAISYSNRDAWCVWARTMVAYQMTLEGYSSGEIGRQMEKDHSTIIYLRRKMQDALDYPQAYKDIIPIWERFQELIRYDIHEGRDGSPQGI